VEVWKRARISSRECGARFAFPYTPIPIRRKNLYNAAVGQTYSFLIVVLDDE
jgi:hypothetical protein